MPSSPPSNDSTLANCRCNYRNHLEPALGTMRMDRITRQHVLRFLAELHAKGLMPRTERAIYNQLRSILRSAVHDRVLVASPCYKITLPKVPPKEFAFLTPSRSRLCCAPPPPPPAISPFWRLRSAPACARASCSASPLIQPVQKLVALEHVEGAVDMVCFAAQ